jgi:citrate lyase beta subunit
MRTDAAWSWYAHLTVPASDAVLIRKAMERGTAPTARILDGVGIDSTDLAAALDQPVDEIRELLEHPQATPLVVVDGEDGLAPGSMARRRAIEATVDALAGLAHPQTDGRSSEDQDVVPTARRPAIFYRSAGTVPSSSGFDVAEICGRLAERGERGGLDGVVLPKAAGPADVAHFSKAIARAEHVAGLPEGHLGLMVLVESAAGFAGLPGIVAEPDPRLCALVFGVADYAADVGLPSMNLDHPVTFQARLRLIEAAAVAGVPAVDGMTLSYPVAARAGDPTLDRERILTAVRQTYADALAGFELGMMGKWVGHPAQLFAVALARRRFFAEQRIERAIRQLDAVAVAARHGRGVAVVDGAMIDRATARHARGLLARAAAAGALDTGRLAAIEEQGDASGD